MCVVQPAPPTCCCTPQDVEALRSITNKPIKEEGVATRWAAPGCFDQANAAHDWCVQTVSALQHGSAAGGPLCKQVYDAGNCVHLK